MASGQTHTLVTVAAAGLAGVLVLPLAVREAQVLAVVPGCLAGMFLSPDLDISRSISSWHVRRFGGVAGELLSFLWRCYWWPYAAVIPHRHWISHAPLISTWVRLLYLFAPSLLLLYLLGLLEPLLYWALGYPTLLGAAVAGLSLSDALHWLLDLG